MKSARIICWSLFLSAAACPAVAQGTRADYERAGNLRRLTEGKVVKSRVRPRWLSGGKRFWYRNDLSGGAREFVLVDAEKGARGPAFDHGRMAVALSKAMGKELDAAHLPLRSIEFQADAGKLLLHAEGKVWLCNLESYELEDAKEAGALSGALPADDAPRPSRRTGAETTLTFVNQMGVEVQVFWLDPEGERRPYGSLRPGEQRDQHTYEGHVWLIIDSGGRTLGVFEATEDAATAVIDGKVRREPQRQRPPRRRRGSDDSPDGKWHAFFKDQDLQVRDLQTGEEFSLSTEGTEEDEYSGPIFWSPDSTKVVALRTRKGDDRKVYYVESSPKDQLQPKLHSYFYLKPGDRVPVSKPQLFDVVARSHIPVSDALFANPWSVTDVRWDGDSRRFTFLYNERGHQVLRLVAVDAATGEARSVVEEKSSTFIDYAHKQFAHHVEATREIIWMSERDGWNHLYLHDGTTGQVKNQMTRGEWVVRGVDRVDEDARQVWFRAGGIRPDQDPYHVHYCRVNFDGSGLVVLTEGDGNHSVEFSPDRGFIVDTWSRVDLPPVTELRRSTDGTLVCELERADWSELLASGWRAPERFSAKGRDGQTDIHGIIIRPTNFDENKKYPVIENIYAGPQDSHVPKSFRPYYESQSLAELGFIVVHIDGMGTSNRSKKFHDVCWKNLGDSGLPDRILWLRAAAAKHPSMDLTRVGIYGGSAGGQSALRALLAHGDVYKVAVADCGCHDNRMDKIWWNELWMGWPVGPHYEEQSNVTLAHKLQGKLLLFVGEMDENVDPASTLQVVNALEKADKDFDLVIMTGTGHGSAETPYGRRRRADFFVRHLLGVEPRAN